MLHLAALEDTQLADFERLVRVNQIGTFLGIRAVVAPMREAGGGSIVNVSSVDGLGGQERRRRLRLDQVGGARHHARSPPSSSAATASA